jgi:two-component sensor histidine kinase/PAS domain-containing protein
MIRSERLNIYMLIAGFSIVALIFATGVFFIDSRAVKKQGEIFNDNQFIQTFLVSQSISNHIEHLQLYPEEMASNSIPNYLKGTRPRNSIEFMFIHKGESFKDYISEIYFDNHNNIVFSYFSTKMQKQDAIKISAECSSIAPVKMSQNNAKTSYFSRIFFYNDIPLIGITYPVFSNGTHTGNLVCVISLQHIISRYIESMKSSMNGQAFAFDDTGQIIFHHKSSYIGNNIFDLKIDIDNEFKLFIQDTLSNLSGKSSFRVYDETDSRKLTRKFAVWNTIKIGDHRLIVVLSAPEIDVEEGLSDLKMQRTLLSILLIIIFAAFAIFASYNRQKTLIENTKKLNELVNKKSAELSEEEMRYHTIFEESPISLWEFDLSQVKEFVDKFSIHNTVPIENFLIENNTVVNEIVSRIIILDANKTSLQMFGFNTKQELFQNFWSLFAIGAERIIKLELSSLRRNDFTLQTEAVFNLKNGETLFTRLFCVIVPGHEKNWTRLILSITDITTIKTSEERLLVSLSEKETLLRELYHRTKNNMQVICSMLSLQSATSCNEDLKNAFRQMENKIHSMALVHQKLYQSQNLSSINLKDYVTDLVHHITASYEIYTGKIKTHLNIENINVLLDIAIPFGLILSELISNSMKYAFPEDRTGEIKVSLLRENEDLITLIVADDGIGPPQDFDIRRNGKMGMKSIIALAELQLQGSYTISNESGCINKVSFKDRLYKERI